MLNREEVTFGSFGPTHETMEVARFTIYHINLLPYKCLMPKMISTEQKRRTTKDEDQ